MTEEIHDIYDGTIIIKAVAREAGERSKVAVYSNDVNVDPAGACIGPNGSRIQKVVSQLGNGSSKEKIDIIAYKDNAGLYIMEALKPAKVAGISVDEENKSAIVIVEDDSLSLAIGRKGVNARLANKLTGYNIDIKIKSEALEEGLEYQTFDELNALEMEEKARKIAEAQREALVYQNKEESLPGVPEGYVAPQARNYEEEQNDFDAALMEQAEVEEVIAPVNEVKEETPVQAQEEKVEEVAPVEEAPAIETTEVKTTTTLEDLEKSLEGKGNKQAKKGNGPKRKKKAEEEQQESVVTHADGPRMAIYTEEELKEIEAEENDDYVEEDEDDIDYDDYDQYYDED
jgi:N utilization substance protein A